MELCFTVAVTWLVLVQAFHATSMNLPPDPTDSSGRTIDKAWLREPVKGAAVDQGTGAEEEARADQEVDGAGMESSADNIIGLPYGSMSISSGEDEDIKNQAHDTASGTSGGVTIMPTPTRLFPTEMEPKLPEKNHSQTTHKDHHSIKVNGSKAKDVLRSSTPAPQNVTAHPITWSSAGFPNLPNVTGLEETTSVPETNDKKESSGDTEIEYWLTNSTEVTSSDKNATTTEVPEINKAPNTSSSSSTDFPSKTIAYETSPVTVTTACCSTPEEANMTEEGSASGSNSDRGLASNLRKNQRSEAWGAVLGTAVAVCLIGIAVYVILKKKNQRDFSHRKLVEFSSDPVLRLDSSEPLDLNYGPAYNNSALQIDNIQMSSFPDNHPN